MSDVINRASLSLSAAMRALELGIKRAEALALPVTIVVVDDAGTVKAQARMDGASLISVVAAQAKAYTSAASGFATGDFHAYISSDPALASTIPHLPGVTTLAGGFVLRSGDAIVGAVGVSGGHYDQDCEIAQAAVAAVA